MTSEFPSNSLKRIYYSQQPNLRSKIKLMSHQYHDEVPPSPACC